MNRIIVALALVVLALLPASPADAQAEHLLSEAVAATAWHSANFKHVFRLHGTDQKVVESGKVTFGDLPQMRWQYRSPEEKVFVFDGRTSWLYVPAERQVSVHELSDSERSQLPFLLIEDTAAAKRDFRFASSRKDGVLHLSLTPRSNQNIRSLELSIDPDSKRIRVFEYLDLEGNLTRFEFDEFRKVSKDPGQFRFEAPPGVEPVEY